jgi:acyl-CoA dehydrogenase
MGELPEDVRVMRDTIRRFVEEELDPIADQVEEEDRIPDHIVDRMRELGLFGMVIPEEYGGLGLSMLGVTAVMEA